MKRIFTSVVLSVCMLLSCVTVCGFSATAASANDPGVSAEASDSVAADYGLAKNVKDGQILQAWNWSYSGIKNNMKKIAEQGFSAVQTSPIQTIKESTQGKSMQGHNWVYYQPINFKIDTNSRNALGTKSDFKEMCDEAHKYGVNVIVDVILNHMANKGNNTLSDSIPSDIRNDENCWHSVTVNTKNWQSRYDITHHCMNGLPDLNTGNSKIQNYEIAFMKECIDCGADGFRFDGAKHIEVPDDYENASSNFWNRVINTITTYAKGTRGITPYYYGEILSSTGGGQHIVNQYNNYMSITSDEVSKAIRIGVNSGDAKSAKRTDFSYSDGSAPPPKYAVLWNESHDTYKSNVTRGLSNKTMKKTWAIVGTRGEAQAMYFARPSDFSDPIGLASVTAWGDKEVAAVNHFKNYFVGQSEYLSASGSIVYNERGKSGVVLVNVGGDSASVSVKANKMSSGTYKDEITGNTFTVSGGMIKGKIGSTGVAVVYNPKLPSPTASVSPGSSTYKTDSLTLTLKYENASSGQYSIDNGSFKSYSNGQQITVGSGKAFGSVTTVKVKSSNSLETSDVKTYTYTKVDPSVEQQIWFDTSQYHWSNVFAYIYIDDNNKASSWPGIQMKTDSSTGYRYLDVPEGFEYGKVIFTEGEGATTNRYPASQEPGMDLSGQTVIFRSNKLEPYNPGGTKPTDPPQTTAPATTPTDPTAPSAKILIGDATMDGIISINDATQIQRHIADIKPLSGKAKIAADVNSDGYITIKDATAVQQYLAFKLSQSGNCGKYVEETPDSKVYFMNTEGWSSVKAYFWSDDDAHMMTWPGNDMQSEGGNIYSADIPSGATHVIFNKGDGSGKTPTLDVQAGKIYSDGNWLSYSGGSYDINTVYFKNTENWSTVMAYFWSDDEPQMMTWPGIDTQNEGNGVFSAVIPDGATYVIFNKGDGSGKTDKLTVHGGQIYENGSWHS